MSLVRPRRGLRRTTRIGNQSAKEGERQTVWRRVLKPMSDKERAKQAAWRKRVKELRARASSRCEVVLGWLEIPGYYSDRFDHEWPARCYGIGTDPHHVVKRSQGGTDELTNLLLVCREDHRWFDAHPEEWRGKLMAEPSASPDVAPRTFVTRESKWERRANGSRSEGAPTDA